jgi:hypothetical protein
MIEWKNIDEVPPDGTIVAVLIMHWKADWPQSAEIYFGEVESYEEKGERKARVLNHDYIGGGSKQWYFYETHCYDKISAWAFADEFNIPEFFKEDKKFNESSDYIKMIPPEISNSFDKNLLSYPAPNFFKEL